MFAVFITQTYFGMKTAENDIIFFYNKVNEMSKSGAILFTLHIFPEEKNY